MKKYYQDHQHNC